MKRIGEHMRVSSSVAARALAATIGAYGLTSLAMVVLSLLLARIGLSKLEAVTAATLASFAIFALIAMAAFHARTAVHAWAWLLCAALPLALATFALLPGAKG
jgi:hypothetical protein